MRPLPPLNALKSFESAARTGSYVAAAEELGVTPAAVSQQVKQLEAFLKRKLFTRHNNRIVLTDAGSTIFAGITPCFEDIAATVAQVMPGSGRPRLVVSVIPSLAECWFVPAFAAFTAQGSSLRIDLRVESDPADAGRGEIDLRIGYGGGAGGDLHRVPLFRDTVLPVCAPSLAAKSALAAVDERMLIHTFWGDDYASHPQWPEWFARFCPARRVDVSKGHRIGSSLLAIDFARRGLGIALAQKHLADEDLKAGRLVAMSEDALPLGHDYCAVYSPAKARRAGLLELVTYLRERSRA